MSDLQVERLALSRAVAPASGFRPAMPSIAAFGDPTPQHACGQSDEEAAYEAGRREAERAFVAERDALLALLASAQALVVEPSEELAALIAEAVGTLVTRIAGSAPVDGDWLLAQARRAVDLIDECDRARTMWLHPDDLDLLKSANLPLELRADPGAARGSIRIDCSQGWIEAGRSVQLEKLRAQLGAEVSSR